MYKFLAVLFIGMLTACDQSTAPVQDHLNDVVNPRWSCAPIAQGDSIIGTERCTRDDSTSVTWSYMDDSRDDGWQVVTVGADTIINVSW